MAKILGGMYSIHARGHFPYPYIIAFKVYPRSYNGLYNAQGWIYQVRRTWHGLQTVAEKYYTPYNPQTQSQQANRQKITDGVSMWKGFDQSIKDQYNLTARVRGRISGYALYLSYYLKSH